MSEHLMKTRIKLNKPYEVGRNLCSSCPLNNGSNSDETCSTPNMGGIAIVRSGDPDVLSKADCGNYIRDKTKLE